MGGRTTCLLPALFLLVIPGSSAISGPRAVRGVERGSLTVRCRYDPGYERYVKWWCRGAAWNNCRFVIKTTGSEKEVKKGRVSIRDNQKDRSFTVTMEELRLDDSDTYWCGIERNGTDLGNTVEVTIDPAPTVLISTLATSNANMFTAPVAPKENQGQLLFVPERPQHRDGRRGGLPERGVSLRGGIQRISQILVQTAMFPALAADSADQRARGGGEERPGVHHGPSGGPRLHSDLGKPHCRRCREIQVWGCNDAEGRRTPRLPA
ncbi:CMRF35-like molecule 5 isoform X1 [Bos indicus]|uniref:CMRF35-like molecule 5 isoform X1 n=1 Tax=Bos indicus TaxID=9915 RepID=A0ABM4R3U9_BOSIN